MDDVEVDEVDVEDVLVVVVEVDDVDDVDEDVEVDSFSGPKALTLLEQAYYEERRRKDIFQEKGSGIMFFFMFNVDVKVRNLLQYLLLLRCEKLCLGNFPQIEAQAVV